MTKKPKLKSQAHANSNLLKGMEVFEAVAETGQMTAAARMLGLTQSAASQHIATLEKAYGAVLFDRSVRPARLTQAGTLLHRHAARILNEVNDLETEMRHQGPTPISVLRLGILASIATTLTPGLVALAKKGFGVRDVTLHAGLSTDHETLLRTRKADLAITSNPFYDMEGLERHAVLQESFLLVVPAGYRGPTDSLDSIQKRLPLIRFADTTGVGRLITQHLRRIRLTPQEVIQADRSSMVTACVCNGMGFTLLTPTLLIDGLVERMPLRVLPLPAARLTRTITVVARERELGDFPARVTEMTRDKLVEQVGQYMGETGTSALTLAQD
ncbi:LysR family transcriptional regulator [Aestuariivirga litoralis]|uniref:LysR family transcriptional regulator n=1 Tax=Aestuariivirga litoralis TaxID=2650924 RepID=UPI0018C62AE6|nr:LysR family transcriptional regulator [Aestuariivirga litoralis]MBG1232578.1 LysR family transcriptional regulator [Aestuariivirga litoralis]